MVKKQRKCPFMPKRAPKHTQILEQAFVKDSAQRLTFCAESLLLKRENSVY